MPAAVAPETDVDRWSHWRRAAAVAVTPPGERLFRVVTCDGEAIIGLSGGQLAALRIDDTARYTAGDLLRKLDRVGYLAVWEYAVRERKSGERIAEPLRQTPLFARQTVRIEHFDLQANREVLGIAA